LLHSRDFDAPALDEVEFRHHYERTLKRSAQLRHRRTRRWTAGATAALACLLTAGLVTASLGATPSRRTVAGSATHHTTWRLVSDVAAPGSSWRALSPSGYKQTFSLVCPSDTTCYAGSIGGQLEYTHDGGSTWQRASSIGTATLLTRISCADARDCDVLADNAGHESTFFTTTDGGQSWTSHHGPAVPNPSKDSVTNDVMSCTTISSCVVIAYQGDSSGSFSAAFTTSDGGASWSQATLPSPSPSQFLPTGLSCSDKTCVAVGANGVYGARGGHAVRVNGGAAYTSDDGGATWSASPAPPRALTWSLTCPDAADCYAAIENAVYQTKDGGQAWSRVSTSGVPGPSGSSSRWNFLAMSCASSSSCWLSGASKLPANPASERAFFSIGQAQGLLASTTDGGATWALSKPPAGVGGVADVTCPDTTTCFALGIKQTGSASSDFKVVLLTNAS
jgi:photosystem II stability/assembly factor-like uncharacterized protein